MLVLLRRGMRGEVKGLSRNMQDILSDDVINETLRQRELLRQQCDEFSARVVPHVTFGRLLQSTRIFLTDDGHLNADTLKAANLCKKLEDISAGHTQLKSAGELTPGIKAALAPYGTGQEAPVRAMRHQDVEALAADTDQLMAATELAQTVQDLLANTRLDEATDQRKDLPKRLADLAAMGDRWVKVGRLPGMLQGILGTDSGIIEDLYQKLTSLSTKVDQMVTDKLLRAAPPQWEDEATARALLLELWRNQRREQGQDALAIDEDQKALDDESLLLELEGVWFEEGQEGLPGNL